MSDKDKTQPKTLDSLSIFSALSPDQQQQITAQTTHLSIKTGQTLITEGEKADTIFFLQQKCVALKYRFDQHI